MQLAWGPQDEAFRADLVDFLDAYTPEEVRVGFDFQGDVGDERELVPQWMRNWQATLFDHQWMIPGYPAELGGRNCTPVQTLIYLETLASRRIPRAGHFPGYAIVAPSLLEFGNEEQRGDGAERDPRRHDLVHRHERAQRGFRSRRPADTRRSVRRPFRRERSEGLDVVRDHRPEVLLLRTHRSHPPEAQGHLAAHPRHGQSRHRHPAAAPPQRDGRIRGGLFHRCDRAPRQPRRRPQRRMGYHAGISRPRTRRTLGRERRPSRANGRRARRTRAEARPRRRSDHSPQDRGVPRARFEPAPRSATRASRRSRRARRLRNTPT